MATFSGLILKLIKDLKPLETALDFHRHPENDPQENQRNQLMTDRPGQPHPTLFRSYHQYFNDLRDLEAQDNSRGGRFNLLTALLDEGETPDEAKITEIKEKVAQRHINLEAKLEALNERQYKAFEKELDDTTLSFTKKETLLGQLKKAQQDQVEGLKARAVNDQRYLTNFLAMKMRADAAEHILRGLSPDNAKAMGTPYRFGPFAAIKKRFFLKDDEANKYDSPEEVAMDIAEQSGTSMQRLQKDDRGKWITQEEAKKGAVRLGASQKKLEGAELDWPEFTSNYLVGRDTLTFTDAPSLGVFKGMGLMSVLRGLNLSGGGSVTFNLNDTIHPNPEEGIPGAKGAVTCMLPRHMTSSLGSMFLGTVPGPVIGTLNILSQIYMAKGWKGVEWGYITPKEYWDEAYLAARRAGFAHSEILFCGNLMTNQELIDQGNAARKKIDDVYAKKSTNPTLNIAHALGKLAIPIDDPNPNLDPRRFFHGEPAQQLALFKSASLNQRAAILASSAFPTNDLPAFLNYPGQPSPGMPAMTEPEKAQVLEIIYAGIPNSIPAFLGNPSRAFEAFQTLAAADRLSVFKSLKPETAANLLMRFAPAEQLRLLNGVSMTSRVNILTQPNLSDGAIYALFKGLPTEKEREALVNELAKTGGTKALGVIIAQMFVDHQKYAGTGVDQPQAQRTPAHDRRDREVVELLEKIVKKVSPAKQGEIMSAVYKALPSGRRQRERGAPRPGGEPGAITNDNFLSMLWRRDDESQELTRELRDLYQVPLTAAAQPKLNEAEIARSAGALATAAPPRATLDAFFQEIDAQQAANAILQSTQPRRTAQLNNLIADAGADVAKRNKVVAVVKALGANVVGNMFNTLNDDNLITFLKDANEGKFLAEMLTVYYNGDRNTRFYNNWDVAALTPVIPHLNHPELIGKMLANRSKDEMIQLLTLVRNDPVQQANLFRSLTDAAKKLAVFANLDPKQQKELFHCLAQDQRLAHLDAIAARLNDRGTKTNTANQIIAYLSDPSLKEVDREALYGRASIHDNLQSIIEANTTPNVTFLAHYLKNAPDLKAAFDSIINTQHRQFQEGQEKNYLDKVARALVLLPQEKQQALFDEYLAEPEEDDANNLTVRTQFLIHLATEKNGLNKARAFLNSVSDDDDKKMLKDEIKRIADGDEGQHNASPFRAVLHELIGEPVRPAAAAARPPGPGPGPGNPGA